MARGRKAEKRIDAIPPTREQELQAEYRLEPITERGQVIGTAYRRRAMIDILHERGILDEPLYKALKHYRHHADIADKSPIRDSLTNWMPKASGGTGPGIELLNAIRVRDDCERAAMGLVDIQRSEGGKSTRFISGWQLIDWLENLSMSGQNEEFSDASHG